MNCTASDLGRERSPEAMWHAYRDASVPRRVRKNVVTTTYAYDINNERIQIAGNASTTTYPFMLYNVASSTSAKIISKHVFANGEGVADVQGTGASAKADNIHGDWA